MIGAAACRIMSGGEHIEPGRDRGRFSYGGRHWNTEREKLRWLETNLDARSEHVMQLCVRETEVAPGF